MLRLLAPLFLSTVTVIVMALGAPVTTAQTPGAPSPAPEGAQFQPSAQCMTCHNGLTTPSGEDVSIGTLWRASMMAHSARDPYWHAGVRREVTDHPRAQAAIENECSRCHMPMAHVQTQALGGRQSVFAHIPGTGTAAVVDPLAVEGVSCALCHQINSDGLGSKVSFTGGFVIDAATPQQGRRMFGPYEVEPGPTSIMRSATGLQPTAATHIQESEVCATCHTLYTHALNADGKATSEFPEQMPYQEWLHSEFRDSQSCQSCHMPVVAQPMPIASVIGRPREAVSRHDFRGANFLMLGIQNRYRAGLGVVARPGELDAAITRTKAFLQSTSATVSVEGKHVAQRLEADVVVRNLAGHKLPTAYPSRRVWLRLTVHDGEGRLMFSSGAVESTGAIAGNDNDRDASRFEPHYREIRSGDEVQIYEAVMGTETGQVTTGLLSAVSYLKDNRLSPRGFDKRTAPRDVAVQGDALADPDFAAGEDRVRYSIDTAGARGPFTIEAQLWYQSIAYRWARNLSAYTTAEPQRFVSYYDQVSPDSALMLTRAIRTVEP